MTNDEYNSFILKEMSSLEEHISKCLNKSLSLPERLAIHGFIFEKYPWIELCAQPLDLYQPIPALNLSLPGVA